MGYHVKTDIFEGPFDLLVYLIEHSRMSIYDVSISEITDQYIGYVREMQKADLKVSSEFMLLASELLKLKSEMLLPGRDTADDEPAGETDSRSGLINRLMEYRKYRIAAARLEEMAEKASRQMGKPREDPAQYSEGPFIELETDTEKFTDAFRAFLERKKRLEAIRHHNRKTEKEKITSEIRIEEIKRFFEMQDRSEADFAELVSDTEDRYDISVTFSSVLEMVKQGDISARQRYLYDDIVVTACGGDEEKG